MSLSRIPTEVFDNISASYLPFVDLYNLSEIDPSLKTTIRIEAQKRLEAGSLEPLAVVTNKKDIDGMQYLVKYILKRSTDDQKTIEDIMIAANYLRSLDLLNVLYGEVGNLELLSKVQQQIRAKYRIYSVDVVDILDFHPELVNFYLKHVEEVDKIPKLAGKIEKLLDSEKRLEFLEEYLHSLDLL